MGADERRPRRYSGTPAPEGSGPQDTVQRPGIAPLYTERTPRVVAARKLTKRSGREKAGQFLVEGAQAVREALASSVVVRELFVTSAAQQRNSSVVQRAADAGVPVSSVTERAAASLSETITPQGIIALCDVLEVPLDTALHGSPKLVAVLAEIGDPGNAGTVLRAADAAGADAVILAGDAVDVHNGKCVRASTGSVFHLPVARTRTVADAVLACREAGLRVVGTSAAASSQVRPGAEFLAMPTAWVFGSEAHGLADTDVERLDELVALPIFGRAESLNLAAAAAVCLYSSAFAMHD